jgi:hypothetical protein
VEGAIVDVLEEGAWRRGVIVKKFRNGWRRVQVGNREEPVKVRGTDRLRRADLALEDGAVPKTQVTETPPLPNAASPAADCGLDKTPSEDAKNNHRTIPATQAMMSAVIDPKVAVKQGGAKIQDADQPQRHDSPATGLAEDIFPKLELYPYRPSQLSSDSKAEKAHLRHFEQVGFDPFCEKVASMSDDDFRQQLDEEYGRWNQQVSDFVRELKNLVDHEFQHEEEYSDHLSLILRHFLFPNGEGDVQNQCTIYAFDGGARCKPDGAVLLNGQIRAVIEVKREQADPSNQAAAYAVEVMSSRCYGLMEYPRVISVSFNYGIVAFEIVIPALTSWDEAIVVRIQIAEAKISPFTAELQLLLMKLKYAVYYLPDPLLAPLRLNGSE